MSELVIYCFRFISILGAGFADGLARSKLGMKLPRFKAPASLGKPSSVVEIHNTMAEMTAISS
jgi:hypothetical protein